MKQSGDRPMIKTQDLISRRRNKRAFAKIGPNRDVDSYILNIDNETQINEIINEI